MARNPDAEEVLATVAGGMVLTSRRVYLDARSWGQVHYVSIMLEDLSSSQLRSRSQPWLLVLAGAATVAGLFGSAAYHEAGYFVVGLIAAGVLALIFLVARQMTLSLASAGHDIDVRCAGMNADDVIEFIGNVEAAKNDRYMLLASSAPAVGRH